MDLRFEPNQRNHARLLDSLRGERAEVRLRARPLRDAATYAGMILGVGDSLDTEGPVLVLHQSSEQPYTPPRLLCVRLDEVEWARV